MAIFQGDKYSTTHIEIKNSSIDLSMCYYSGTTSSTMNRALIR